MSFIPLSHEMYWLTLTTVMTGLMWVPYILNRMLEQGPAKAVWDPLGITRTDIRWADRMMRAHANAVENLVIFVPLVLVVQISHLNNTVTEVASMVYFFSRLAHYLVFTFGIPVLRVVCFMLSVAAQLSIAAVILEYA